MILVLTSEYSSSSVKKVMTVSEAIIDIGESPFGLELDEYQTFVINKRDAKDEDERIFTFEKQVMILKSLVKGEFQLPGL